MAGLYCKWLNKNKIDITLISISQLDKYFKYMMKSSASEFDVVAGVTVVKDLHHHLLERGILDHNPIGHWRATVRGSKGNRSGTFRPKRSQPEYIFSIQEIQDFLDEANRLPIADQASALAANHRKRIAAAELVYSSGIAVNELATLKIDQFGSDIRHFLVRWNGSERTLPLTRHALEAVQRWIEAGSKFGTPLEGHLFYALRTLQPENSAKIGKDIETLSIQMRGQGARRFSATALRNAFAVHLLQNGANPGMMAHLLGYSRIHGLARHIRSANLT